VARTYPERESKGPSPAKASVNTNASDDVIPNRREASVRNLLLAFSPQKQVPQFFQTGSE